MNPHQAISRARVRFAETDKFGFAYHGAYFAWFEIGRTEWLRDRGMTYVLMMERGLHLPVVSTEARFLRPVAYDDIIEIRTKLAGTSGVRIAFDYEIRREGSDQVLTLAKTEHASVDDAGRPKRFPEDIVRLLQ